MSQRLYSYEQQSMIGKSVEYDCYARNRPRKLNDIQAYTSILMQNNKTYQQEINALRMENAKLRGQVQVLLGDNIKLKRTQQEQLMQLKSGYNKEVTQLINELKDILREKQNMQRSYQTVIQEIKHENLMNQKNKKSEIDELERMNEFKVRKFTDKIQQQQRQLQKNYYDNSQNKIKYVQQNDGLKFELNEMRKYQNQLNNDKIQLQQQLLKINHQINEISIEKQNALMDKLKVQQQKNQIILNLKDNGSKLKNQFEKNCDNLVKLEKNLFEKQKECSKLFDQNKKCFIERDNFEKSYLQYSKDLKELMNSYQLLNVNYSKLQQKYTKESKKNYEIILILEKDNQILKSNIDRLTINHLGDQKQIQELLNTIQKFRLENQSMNSQAIKFAEQAFQDAERRQTNLEQIQILKLEFKRVSQKLLLLQNHNKTIEDLLEKQKQKIKSFQENNNGRILQNTVNNIQQISRSYQKQIQKILHESLQEKNLMKQSFQIEKNRILKIYQQALKEKEIIFKQRISRLENSISAMQ